MGRKRKIPKKLVVPAKPMVEKPPKIYHTAEAFYLDHLRSLCARAENPTSLVEGKSLDEHAHFVRHRLSHKGKLLWYHINSLHYYDWNSGKHPQLPKIIKVKPNHSIKYQVLFTPIRNNPLTRG